jgi:hypothetical protein
MVFYPLVIFLSAFLLFQIEPLIGKYILPWFGGVPATWSAAVLFFQVLLLAGYAYAYWIVQRFSPRKQALLHLAVVGVSLAALCLAGLRWNTPITPGPDWKPLGISQPVVDIFKILAVGVGLPYFVLSTSSPLLQSWFSQNRPGLSPYRLYALSNAGSLLALVSYPFLVEPAFSLTVQGKLWAWGYLGFGLGVGWLAIRILRRKPPTGDQPSPAAEIPVEKTARPAVSVYVLWAALAACASVLLLATTNELTQEVAPIPFLWVLPLAIYLLTYVLCFSGGKWYFRSIYTPALFIASALYIVILVLSAGFFLAVQVAVYAFVLFVGCMICNGELARLKPEPRRLTAFYLTMALGSALGGAVVTFIAPLIFKGYWEYPIGLLLCWALVGNLTLRDAPRAFTRPIVLALAAGTCVLSFLVLTYAHDVGVGDLYAARNFYGIVRVKMMDTPAGEPEAYQLMHGATVHGIQFLDPVRHDEPTTYYTEDSGVGLALKSLAVSGRGSRIGVLGLGIGTLAAYGAPGDLFRFYEVNPAVIRLAEGQGGYFSFLKDSAAKVEVIPGDARLSLERELAAGASADYDLLVVDTFNSGAIPVHLLTKDAFDIYLRRLQPDGVLALHISNLHLNLQPVVWELADYFHLNGAVIESRGDGERSQDATWMLLSRNPAFFHQPLFAGRTTPRAPSASGLHLWTDDYSNLFQILK